MKYITIILSLILIHPICNAEPHSIKIDAYCDDTDRIFSALTMMKEIPIAIAQANDVAESKVLLWVDPTKESWTLTASKDKVTCVIGYGSAFNLIIPRKKNSN
jgi:hypothetical protein